MTITAPSYSENIVPVEGLMDGLEFAIGSDCCSEESLEISTNVSERRQDLASDSCSEREKPARHCTLDVEVELPSEGSCILAEISFSIVELDGLPPYGRQLSSE